MLDKMREGAKGIVSWGIVLIIGVTFALWGVSDYFTGGRKNTAVAVVNGEKITVKTFEDQVNRVQQQIGYGALDPKYVKENVLAALIAKSALTFSMRSLGFRVNDENIVETIINIPAFQVDGKFSKERYLEVLSKADYTDVSFRRELEREVLINQLEHGLKESSFSLPAETERLLTLFDQRRDFTYALLSQDQYQSDIKIAPEETQAYYDKFRSKFISPERISVEYVLLSLDQLAKQENVSEEELKDYYNEHIASYTAPERVNARHILISFSKNPEDKTETATIEAKAKEKAEAIMTKLKNGEDFATLAKAESDDKGSATRGGELGWFIRGQMVPEFEKATFGLKQPKDLAGPIRTQFGYHIIELIDKKPAETRPFTEIRDLVLEQVQREKAQITFAEKSERMATLAFENKSSLQPISEALGLKIEESGLFNRQGIQVIETAVKKPNDKEKAIADTAKADNTAKAENETHQTADNPNTAPQADNATNSAPQTANAANDVSHNQELFKNPLVVTAAFSDLVLNEKGNSEVVQLGESSALILRLKKHQPAEQQTLEQVQKIIEERLVKEKAKLKVKELAESMQKRIREGEAATAVANELNLSWVNKTEVNRQGAGLKVDKNILYAAFDLPYRFKDEKKHAVQAVPLTNGDYAVLILDKVIPGDVSKTDVNIKNAYRQNLSEGIAQMEFSLYTTNTVNEAKIEFMDQPS